MQRDEHPVDINPDKETAERQDLSMMPGRQEDIETASARANRVGDRDVTAERPREDRGAAEGGAAENGPRTTPADHPLREGL
jgi:hypothetical protein